jgi:hypothetical protein
MYVFLLIFGIGIAFNDVKGQLYPIIGIAGGGISVCGKLGLKPPEKIKNSELHGDIGV